MKLKIGLLCPRSDMYPTLGKDLLNGLKLSFGKYELESPDFIIESIGTGSEEDVLNKAEKLILERDVNVLIGFAGFKVIEQLMQLSLNYEVPFFHLDLGGNYWGKYNQTPYTYHLTLGLWQSCWLTGKYLPTINKKNIAIATSFYDGGYHLVDAFVKGLNENKGQIVHHYVAPFKKEDWNFDQFKDRLLQEKPDALFAVMSYKESTEFLEKYHACNLHQTIPIYSSPVMVDETFLNKQLLDVTGVKNIASWNLSTENTPCKPFYTNYQSVYKKRPNIISMLGFEAGQFTAEWNHLAETKGMSGSEIQQIFKQITIQSPRGAIGIDMDTQETSANHFLRELNQDNEHFQQLIIKNLDDLGTPKIKKDDLKNLPFSGWFNPYICT